MNKKLPPLFSFVGSSGSGKTTFLEKLVTLFSERGYKVGAIKHDAHKFEIDKPGKDSYRLKHAGAKEVVIASKEKVAMVKDLEEELSVYDVILNYFDDVDLVFTEGYKRSTIPKIEVYRIGNEKEPVCFDDKTLIGIVTDFEIEQKEVEIFGLDDYEKVADFILEKTDLSPLKVEVDCESEFLKRFLDKRLKMLKFIGNYEKIRVKVELE